MTHHLPASVCVSSSIKHGVLLLGASRCSRQSPSTTGLTPSREVKIRKEGKGSPMETEAPRERSSFCLICSQSSSRPPPGQKAVCSALHCLLYLTIERKKEAKWDQTLRLLQRERGALTPRWGGASRTQTSVCVRCNVLRPSPRLRRLHLSRGQ